MRTLDKAKEERDFIANQSQYLNAGLFTPNSAYLR